MLKRKLSPAQFEMILTDGRSPKAIAAAFGLSEGYVRGIRRGYYVEAPPLPQARTVSRPERFYRPFQDGTYS